MNTCSSKTYQKKDVLEVQWYKILNSNDNGKFLASHATYSIIKNLEKKTDLQITPYISPKKFCIISYNMDMICHSNTVSYLGFIRGLYSFFSSSTVEHWDRRYSVTSCRRSSKSGDPGKGRRLRQRKQLVKSAPVLCKVSRNDPTKSLKKQNRY